MTENGNPMPGHTRRSFFAVIFAPLVARWLPKPKGPEFLFIGKDCVWGLYSDRKPILIMKARSVGMTTMLHYRIKERYPELFA